MIAEFHGPCTFLKKVRDFSFAGKPSLFFTAALIICLILPFHACSGRHSPTPGSHGNSEEAALTTYTDGIGRRVELPRRPNRIISLAPSVTETLYFLGAQDRLIGVTTQCDWPAEVVKKPRIGDLLNPNYEVILAAKPDLIIASTAGNDRDAVLKLSNLGLPVFVTAPRTVEKILETVQQIGRITDCAAQAEILVAGMKKRLDQVSERLSGLPTTSAFFITWFEPLLTPGKNTFETDVLRLAGIESITASLDDFYPRYSVEQVVTKNPDVILTVDYPTAPLPDLTRIAGWKSLDAVRTGRIYHLNPSFQHPSPRFVDGVEDLAVQLHPERFQ